MTNQQKAKVQRKIIWAGRANAGAAILIATMAILAGYLFLDDETSKGTGILFAAFALLTGIGVNMHTLNNLKQSLLTETLFDSDDSRIGK